MSSLHALVRKGKFGTVHPEQYTVARLAVEHRYNCVLVEARSTFDEIDRVFPDSSTLNSLRNMGRLIPPFENMWFEGTARDPRVSAGDVKVAIQTCRYHHAPTDEWVVTVVVWAEIGGLAYFMTRFGIRLDAAGDFGDIRSTEDFESIVESAGGVPADYFGTWSPGHFGDPGRRYVLWVREHEAGNRELGETIPEYVLA